MLAPQDVVVGATIGADEDGTGLDCGTSTRAAVTVVALTVPITRTEFPTENCASVAGCRFVPNCVSGVMVMVNCFPALLTTVHVEPFIAVIWPVIPEGPRGVGFGDAVVASGAETAEGAPRLVDEPAQPESAIPMPASASTTPPTFIATGLDVRSEITSTAISSSSTNRTARFLDLFSLGWDRPQSSLWRRPPAAVRWNQHRG
jgi:hypothetical protein